MPVSTFDEVAAHYKSIKPVISIHHDRSDDIRPIGQRRYKQERIIKVDDNTYALSDGYHDDKMNPQAKYTPEFLLGMYPILWTRKDDGDYVRIRNGSGNYAHMSRYTFISTYTPRGMSFGIKDGKQYIHIQPTSSTKMQHESYLLPKSKYQWDWGNKTTMCEDDHKYLTFKVLPDYKYERVGHLNEVKTKRIDKQVKAQYKNQLKGFFNWFTIMYGMLPKISWGECGSISEEINKHEGRNVILDTYSPFRGTTSAEFVRALLMDDEHPMRSAFATLLKREVGNMGYGTFTDTIGSDMELKLIRRRYTQLMNKVLDVYAVEQV